jgi:hypothetical protein
MSDTAEPEREALAFISEEIESVPHLEALLLLWRTRPETWTFESLARRLYVEPGIAENLLQGLTRRGLIVNALSDPAGFVFNSEPERERLMRLVDAAYRNNLVRVSTMIHSKPSAALRDFAQAFRVTKERK